MNIPSHMEPSALPGTKFYLLTAVMKTKDHLKTRQGGALSLGATLTKTAIETT